MKRFIGALILALCVAVVLPNVVTAEGPTVVQFLPQPPPVRIPIPPGLLVACCYSVTGLKEDEFCQLMDRIKCLLASGKIVDDCLDCGFDWDWAQD